MAGAEAAFRHGTVTRQLALPVTPEDAAKVAAAERKDSGASHALAVLVQIDEGGDRPDFGATISIGIADAAGTVSRQARLVGGRDWVRIGAAELALDCLRRHLLGLPVDERIDFERR
jgi:nicotinamide-nucleotide amidase